MQSGVVVETSVSLQTPAERIRSLLPQQFSKCSQSSLIAYFVEEIDTLEYFFADFSKRKKSHDFHSQRYNPCKVKQLPGMITL